MICVITSGLTAGDWGVASVAAVSAFLGRPGCSPESPKCYLKGSWRDLMKDRHIARLSLGSQFPLREYKIPRVGRPGGFVGMGGGVVRKKENQKQMHFEHNVI